MARKKALIIGINYTGTEHALNGCINDAMKIVEFLVERGFPPPGEGDMIILTDEAENEGTERYPTHDNILAAFNWLVTDNGPGDVLWLSYSGHGGQVKDLEGERASG
jgi:metacaspase-1